MNSPKRGTVKVDVLIQAYKRPRYKRVDPARTFGADVSRGWVRQLRPRALLRCHVPPTTTMPASLTGRGVVAGGGRGCKVREERAASAASKTASSSTTSEPLGRTLVFVEHHRESPLAAHDAV